MDAPEVSVIGDVLVARFVGEFGPDLKDPDPLDRATEILLEHLETNRQRRIVIDVSGVAGLPDSSHIGRLLKIYKTATASNRSVSVVLSGEQQSIWRQLSRLDETLPSYPSVGDAIDVAGRG